MLLNFVIPECPVAFVLEFLLENFMHPEFHKFPVS